MDLVIEALGSLARLEIWLGGLMCGALMLGGANFLAADYSGPRPAFDVALSGLVFTGMGMFLLLVAPAMVLEGTVSPAPFMPVWFTSKAAHFTPWRAAIAFGIGVPFAILTRLPPASLLLQSRLFACVNQALAMLSTVAYFATEGSVRFVPGPFVLLGLGMSAMLVVALAQGILEALFPRTAARAWIFLAPIIVPVAVAPYAGWVRVVNP